MTIPGGLHAQVHIRGCYGDLLPFIHKLLYAWLAQSQYTMELTPVFTSYQHNQFINDNERFELDLFLPLKAS
ncbi:MAG: GyrI-like domain-containing protein [Spongiibacteraceae bacterium]|nr:GyrI-like domain-containing protein [Spongiibacteraceae bacterium]MBN4055301.1 GyrI-like domain-containing protein [bacterium AH-315-K03]